VDPHTGADVAVGQVGELRAGLTVMTGYHEQPDGTTDAPAPAGNAHR
jgi:hypothetical protein